MMPDKLQIASNSTAISAKDHTRERVFAIFL